MRLPLGGKAGEGGPLKAGPLRPQAQLPEPQAARDGATEAELAAGGRDQWAGRPRHFDSPPWWVVAMGQDRSLGLQRLSPQDAPWHQQVEVEALASWARGVGHLLATPPWPGGPADPTLALAAAQAWSEDFVAAAWVEAERPRLRWVPALTQVQGQFLFDLQGGTIQLSPRLLQQGPVALGTLVHELTHHLQQAVVSALYRGSPALPAPWREVAPWWRDARAAYRPQPSDPIGHQGQALEVGACLMAAAIVRQAFGEGAG